MLKTVMNAKYAAAATMVVALVALLASPKKDWIDPRAPDHNYFQPGLFLDPRKEPHRPLTKPRAEIGDSGAITAEAARRTAKIDEEIAKLGPHEWAGTYLIDSILAGKLLKLAPRSGFACDVGYARSYGDASFDDGLVRLTPSSDVADTAASREMPRDYLLVSWDSLRYLVPTNGMTDLCNAVNAGDRRGTISLRFVLLRQPFDEAMPRGLPKVPAEYQKLLLIEPIEAEIDIYVGLIDKPKSRWPEHRLSNSDVFTTT